MPTTVRLDPALEARLDALSHATGRSKASFLRSIIERGLADEERRWGLDDERSRKLEQFDALAASVEHIAEGKVWPPNVSDKELLGQERMRRFG